MFAPFHFQTAHDEQSRSLVGDFNDEATAVVIAAELLDDSTTLLLCRCPRVVSEDDDRVSVIRRVDRCRAGRLVRLSLEPPKRDRDDFVRSRNDDTADAIVFSVDAAAQFVDRDSETEGTVAELHGGQVL